MAESPAEYSAENDALDDAMVRTVDELNGDIASVVEGADGLAFDYVVGDVSGYRDSTGHVHFDLDYDGSSIHCVVFSFRRTETTDSLEEGTQVAVAGDLSYYEERGSCSILVTDVVELGDGTYEQVYQENKATLKENGLLDDQYKQALPSYPERIGLVTSEDSDAREDAVTSIHDQHPDVDIVVQHATVQGEQALPSLLEAISTLDRDPDVGVIVVTRGGGADTTLRVFNDVALCRVVFETDTPTVVGIGHERDRTLADEVADERVMTPTDVGSIVPSKEAMVEDFETVSEFLDDAYERVARRQLSQWEESLDSAYVEYVSTELSRVESDLDHALASLGRERLTDLDNRLEYAVDALEQEVQHEREKEAATEEIAATYARRERVQRAVIAVLLVLLLGLGAYVLFGM